GEVYEMDNTIQNSTGTDGQQALGTIAVPADAELGNTRMRVKKIFGTTNFLNPCLGASFGQAEDYTINVTEVTGPTGCLTGTLFPATTFTPLCVGDPEVIATNAWAGEYTNVNVTGGITYTFTSANATTTDFITIGNEDGTVVLASGMSPLVWTATSSQVVRFYNHLDAACTTQNTSRTKAVACGDPVIIEEPDFDCFQGDGLAGNGENGYSVFAGSVNRTADDFI